MILEAQIVISTHRADRPVRRAVNSVLDCPSAGVVVVAHGLDPSLLDLPTNDRVEVIGVSDGLGYPGVPFNAGLMHTAAPWIGRLDSDDWYEPGAVEAMLSHAKQDDQDGVIAPIRVEPSATNEIAPASWRRKNLKPGRDHMYFRTAPFGLFKSELLKNPTYMYKEDVPAGEDVVNGAALWTSGLRFSFYPQDPAYVVTQEAPERASSVKRPLSEHASEWRELWAHPVIQRAKRAERKALAYKMVQMHVLPMISSRPTPEAWREGDFEWLSGTARQLVEEVPSLPGTVIRAKRPVFDALIEGDLEETLQAEKGSRSAPYLDWRVASNPVTELGIASRSRRIFSVWLSKKRDGRKE